MGRTTNYNYFPNGIDLQEVRQVSGQSTELVASYTYNAQHQPLAHTNASGQTWVYTYNAAGQPHTITNPKNETTTQVYDANGYLQSVTGPVTGATTTFTYDAYGRVRTSTDADGYTLTYDYDALDRVTKATYPDNSYEQFVYDRLDLERRRDRLGRWTYIFYDALRHAVAVRDPLGQTVTQQWCNCGSLDKLTDANGNALTWERDVQGRVTKEIRADGAQTLFTYETTTSRLKQLTDAKSQQVNYQYFLDGGLQQISYGNAQNPTPSVSFTYDLIYRRLTSMIDGTGTTSYAYNPVTMPSTLGAGELASVDGPLSGDTDKVTYTYDEMGRLLTRAVNGVSSSRVYDALGRVTTRTNPLGTFTFGYVGTSRHLASATYPNGQSSLYTYFPNSGSKWLQEIKNLTPGSAILSKFNYTYDSVGKISTWTRQADVSPASVYEFAYDAADQVVSATLKTTDPTPAILKRYAYGFDRNSNRTSEQIDDSVTAATYSNTDQLASQQAGGALLFRGAVSETATVTVDNKPATVDAANNFQASTTVPPGTSNVVVTATDPSGNPRTNIYQLSQSGMPKTLTYDANGNLVSDGTRTFEWDAQDRLVAINHETNRSEFNYDGLGRRVRIVEKTDGVTVSDRRYLWSSTDLCEERDSSGTTVTKRFYSQGVQDGGAAYYYTRDHLGSIRELTDNTGSIRARYDYDIYGRATKASGDLDASLGFAGYYAHAPSGLALTLYRAYDPAMGRWLSQDPLGLAAGVNFYAYAENNPVSLIDPLGLNPRDKYYGLPKEFWKWYHRQMKEPGEPDLTKPEAEELRKQWKDLGEPDPDGHRTRPVPEPAPPPEDPSKPGKPKDPADPNNSDPDDPKDPGNKRMCIGPDCPEVLVPVVVGTGVGAYVIWKIVKTCGCTAAGGPGLGAVCLATP